MKSIVAINGEIFSPEQAKISVFDRGFLFGDAVYEVTRSYGRILFQVEAHVERLFRSAHALQMNLGVTQTDMIQELYRLHKCADGENAYIRIQVTRGEGPIGLDPRLAQTPNFVVYVKELPFQEPALWEKGVKIVTTDVVRNSKRALDPNIKSGNYLNNILAMMKGTPTQAAECLLVNRDGYITEGTTSNIFMVKNGVISTPSDSHDILFGITRGIVREIITAENLSFEEGSLTPRDLEDADEVFLTSATREVLPVQMVNSKVISTTPGPLTSRLLKVYRERIRHYCEWAQKYHPWK